MVAEQNGGRSKCLRTRTLWTFGSLDSLLAAAIAAGAPVLGFAFGVVLWRVRARRARPIVERYIEGLGYHIVKLQPRLFRPWPHDPLPSVGSYLGVGYEGIVFRLLVRCGGGPEEEIWAHWGGLLSPRPGQVSHVVRRSRSAA